MVSKNGKLEAAGRNCIDAPKFQDAEPIDPEQSRETRGGQIKKGWAG
jgi:hypothetical protein